MLYFGMKKPLLDSAGPSESISSAAFFNLRCCFWGLRAGFFLRVKREALTCGHLSQMTRAAVHYVPPFEYWELVGQSRIQHQVGRNGLLAKGWPG